jgi:hypothetical protein
MVTLEHDNKKQTTKDVETMEVMVAAEAEVPKITTPFKTEQVEIFENPNEETKIESTDANQTEMKNNNDDNSQSSSADKPAPLTIATDNSHDQPVQAQEFTSSPVDTVSTTDPEVTQSSNSNQQSVPTPSPSRSTRRNNKKKKKSKSKR